MIYEVNVPVFLLRQKQPKKSQFLIWDSKQSLQRVHPLQSLAHWPSVSNTHTIIVPLFVVNNVRHVGFAGEKRSANVGINLVVRFFSVVCQSYLCRNCSAWVTHTARFASVQTHLPISPLHTARHIECQTPQCSNWLVRLCTLILKNTGSSITPTYLSA